ncbi:outer membrane receptor protein involved in Fe transport [Undibacterium sp. GrIS 1.2]|uniref:TonB-dependent receptor plug domain-containing protein n=1 Tax=Undibacterium sp. GrIS 1.2 TaxID=3143933 RepID=UPI003399DC8A
MIFNEKIGVRSVRVALTTLAAGSIVISGYARGQTATESVQKIEITGSNIKRTESETSSPVQIVSRQEIIQSGANTVREILDNLTSNTGALSDKGGSNSFAGGASGVSLRQLGKSSTLVLLNSRRVSNYGFADGAQETFVNIDTIPAAVIDRIEILKDGASAIYGSDAVAGVINIITKKEFKGLQFNAGIQRAGTNNSTDKEKILSITGGLGELNKDGFNIFAHLELFQRDAFTTRSILDKVDPWFAAYVNPNVGVRSTYAYPGNFIKTSGKGITGPASGCTPENIEGGLCRFDQWARVEQSPAADRVNLLASGRLNLSNDVTAFSEVQYSKTKTTYNSTPPIMQYTGAASTWYNAKTGTIARYTEPLLPANNPFNPFGAPVQLRYRYADDVSIFKNVAEASQYRVVAGLEGTTSGWDWNAAIGTMGSKAEMRQRGPKSVNGYLNAINSGEYKFGGTNSADLLLRMFPYVGFNGESTTHFADAKATRELMNLPGGATGYRSWRRFTTRNI